MNPPGAYKIVIEPLPEADGGGFLATVPELPGCMSDGETCAGALANVEDAIGAWIHSARKMGRTIPEPQLHRAAWFLLAVVPTNGGIRASSFFLAGAVTNSRDLCARTELRLIQIMAGGFN